MSDAKPGPWAVYSRVNKLSTKMNKKLNAAGKSNVDPEVIDQIDEWAAVGEILFNRIRKEG